MGNIIELPDLKQLRADIEQLRQELGELVCERDELQFTIGKNIEMEYMLKFGALEYKVYNTYCQFLRLRRKKDLLQAKVNRREPYQLQEIEAQLDNEFSQYQEELEKKLGQINQAHERKSSPFLTEEESKRIKKLYRQLIKALHPDLNPELSAAEVEAFNIIVKAYEHGDLNAIELYHSIYASENSAGEAAFLPEDVAPSVLEKMQNEYKRLLDLVAQVKAEITKMKSSFPFNLEIYLDDEATGQQKMAELEKQLQAFQEAIKTQEEQLAQISNSS